MHIDKINIGSFGKFKEKEIHFRSGINVVYGLNEAGKSTLHTYIKGLFYGIEKGRGRAAKDNEYEKYAPWDTPTSYYGTMEFVYQDLPYRISRNFYQKEKKFQMVRLDTGREVLAGEYPISDIFPNLTESNYVNTIHIRQTKVQTDAELAKEIQNYAANLSTSKSSTVNIAEAIKELMTKKKEYETIIKNNKLKDIKESIERCIQNDQQLEMLYVQKESITMEIEKRRQQHREEAELSVLYKESEIPKLYEMRGQAKDYRDLLEEIESLEDKKQKIMKEIENYNSESFSGLQEDCHALDTIQRERIECSLLIEDIEKQIKEKQKKNKKVRLLYMVGSVLACACTAVANLYVIPVVLLFLFIIAFFAQKQNRAYHKSSSEKLKDQTERLNKATDFYQNILRKYHCGTMDEINLLLKKSDYAISRQTFLGESLSEIAEGISIKSRKAEQLSEDLKCYLEERFSYDTNGNYMNIIDNIIYRNDEAKEEIARRSMILKENVEEKERVLDQIEKDIYQYEIHEDTVFEFQKKYDDEKERVESVERELEAIKLAIVTIEELAEEIHDGFGHELNRKLSNMVSEMTFQAYDELYVDEKLHIQVYNGMSHIPLSKLSTGTIDQVYLALRLSTAHILFEGEDMPVILDDSFAYYDDDRLVATLKLLNRWCNQVILFTCQKREQIYLEKESIPYHLICL